MGNYNQYDGSMGQTSMAQRLLNNGSDYIAVRIGQYDYLFAQGHIVKSSSSLSYSGESWLYSSDDRSLTYKENDSGSVYIRYPDYCYSSLPEYQNLSVADVYPKFAFFGIMTLVLVYVGFQCIKRRFVL